jgi:NADPH:quinone reductase-like Zn-dependent oxidoreductase
MRAVAFQRFGTPDVLSIIELPKPTAKIAEIVVKVAASSVNPTDLMMRSGGQADMMTALKPPFIAGMEFSGHVHEVGDPSTEMREGQPVMGIVNPRRPAGGAHAEYICVPAASVVPVPEGFDMVEAATVPMNGMTARMVIESMSLPSGGTVLITGSAGAVGGYVIALAKKSGLHVIADAKDEDRELLVRLGADEVVPRGDGMHTVVRAHFPQGVDALVDCALLGNSAAALVRDGGTAVALRKANVITDPRLRNTHVGVLNEATNTTALQSIAGLLSEGVLKPRIAVRLPFTQAAEAHALLERGGLRGRVVLTFA